MTEGSPPDENDERDDADDGTDEPDRDVDALDELLAEADEVEDPAPASAASDDSGSDDVPTSPDDAPDEAPDDSPTGGVDAEMDAPDEAPDGKGPGASEAAGPTADGQSPGADAEPTADGQPPGADAEPTVTEQTTDAGPEAAAAATDVPEDVRKYERFKKIEGGTYDRANEFLRERTYVTAREWAIARLCADFRTETGVEMTKIGENLPELVPFMTDTYTPQAVNQARAAFEEKVRKAGATFLYGAMCDFFTAEELDDVMYEATEVAKFLLEVEGVELTVEEELATEDRISEVMRDVREHSAALRHDEVSCPECGHEFGVAGEDGASGDGGGAGADGAPGDDVAADGDAAGEDADGEPTDDDADDAESAAPDQTADEGESEDAEPVEVAEATPDDVDD